MAVADKPLLAVLRGRKAEKTPIWLMRQAGRYLPEYRALRAEKGGFLDLVQDPDAAAEVTLQPIRRFGFDGAILFSDILMVPFALGPGSALRSGRGSAPVAAAGRLGARRARLGASSVWSPSTGLWRKSRSLSPGSHDFSWLCRKPVDGRDLYGGRPGQPGPGRGATARLWRSGGLPGDRRRHFRPDGRLSLPPGGEPESRPCNCSTAGPEACRPAQFERWVIAPTASIVAAFKARHPGVPVIGFPKGAGGKLAAYARETGVDAIGLDETVDPGLGRQGPPAGHAGPGQSRSARADRRRRGA